MGRKLLLIVAFAAAAAATACAGGEDRRARGTQSGPQQQQAAAPRLADAPAATHGGGDQHGRGPVTPGRVPAFQTDPAALKNLPPTLSPALFTGTTRLAYQMVGEIPEVVAQLPCYCHCDRGFGHKSLHSCFVDEHGSQCGVCLNEAMAAYRMQKEQGLRPEQIRERIIAQYGKS